jgi:hypothetical protein
MLRAALNMLISVHHRRQEPPRRADSGIKHAAAGAGKRGGGAVS